MVNALKCTRIDNGDETVIHVVGQLDASTALVFRQLADQLVAEERLSITLELSGLELIDNAGTAVIIALYKHTLAKHGHLKIEGIRDQPRAIFRLLRYDRIFSL